MSKTSSRGGRPLFGPAAQTALLVAGFLIGLRAFTFSVNNPDIFWHLSAGRAIWLQRAVPRADTLSYTEYGRPWLDFEWLSQAVYFLLFSRLGVWGLVLIRLAAMAAALWATARLLALHGLGRGAQGLAVLVEALVLLPFGDVRPDNFSLAFFAWLLWLLERRRLRPKGAPARLFLSAAALFAVWANLHLGVLYGLLLIGLYAAGAALERRWSAARESLALLAVAGLACGLNPYGFGLWRVVLNHWTHMALLSASIKEWAAPDLSDPYRWACVGLMLASAAVVLARLAARRGVPWAFALGLAYFAGASLRHDRDLTFFAVFAAPVAFILAKELAAARPGVFEAAGAAVFAVAAAALLRLPWGAPRLLEPSRDLGDFLSAQKAELGSLPLYNTWEDGGYLAWRLAPAYKVFFDGRYIFHDLLGEMSRAAASAQGWRAFLDRRGIRLVCIRRSTLRSFLQDGVKRPYYAAYMPQRDWALVHWDQTRLVFVRRGAVDAAWLKSHEFKYLKPDDAPFAARRESPAPAAAVDAELRRLALEAPSVGADVLSLTRALGARR